MRSRHVPYRLGLLGLALLLSGLALLGRSLPARAQTQLLAVGVLPAMAAVDTRTQQAFVANTGDNTLSLLDLRHGRVERTVPVGPSPIALAVDALHARVLVLNSDTTLSLLDTSGRLLRTVTVGPNPVALALDERSGHAFVATNGDQSVHMLDVRTGQVLRTVRVGTVGVCCYVVVESRAHRVFVGTQGDPHVSVLDTGSGGVRGRLQVDDGIRAVGVDARTGRAFLVHSSDGGLSVLDTRRLVVVRTVRVGAGASSVAVDERAGHVVVINSGAGTLSLLDARSGRVQRTVAVRAADPSAPFAAPVIVDAAHAHVFVLDGPGLGRWDAARRDSLSMLDSRSGQVLRHWRVAAGSVALALDGPQGRLLVVHDALAPAALAGGVAGGLRRAWLGVPQPLRAWLPVLAPAPPRPYTGSVTVITVPAV